MGVMAGAGGLVGAIAGVVLLLLAHAVMGLSSGIVALVPASIGFGALAAVSLGVFLVARQVVRLTWQPHLITTVPEQESISS